MKFKNPSNDYVETAYSKSSWILCLLFGFLYFLLKGNTPHAIMSLILFLATGGISLLIYPFFVKRINKAWYLKQGWVQVDGC